MRSAILAALFGLAGVTGVAAACPSHPDTAATHFVENRTALALCQQRELGLTTDLSAERARIDAAIGNIEIELQRQRLLALERMTQPRWP